MATSIVTTTFPLKKGSPPDFGTLYSGRALEFDGVTDYIDCGVTSNFTTAAGARTVCCWVKLSDDTPSNDYFFCLGNSSNGFALGISSSNYLTFFDTGTNDTTVTEASMVGVWKHLAVTHDGSTTAKIYVNGVLSLTNTTSTLATDQDAHTIIGARNTASSGTTAANHINCKMANFQIWNSALSLAEVQYSYTHPEKFAYNTSGSSLTASNLVAWYPMIEGESSTAQIPVRSPQMYITDGSEKGLGDDLIGTLDFTSGWAFTGSSAVDADSFSTNASTTGGARKDFGTIGKVYKMRIAGTTACTSVRVIGTDTSTVYTSGLGTGSFDSTFYFTSTDSGFRIQGINGSGGALETTITTLTMQEVKMGNHGVTTFYGIEQISHINNRTFQGASNWQDDSTTANQWAEDSGTYDESATSGAEETVFTDAYLKLVATSDGSDVRNAYLDGIHFEDDDAGSAMASGRTYRLSYDIHITAYTSGTLSVGFANASHSMSSAKTDYTATLSARNKTLDFVYDGTTNHAELLIQASTSSAFTCYFDNFSIKEVGIADGWSSVDSEPLIPQTALMGLSKKLVFGDTATYTTLGADAVTGMANINDGKSISLWFLPHLTVAGDEFLIGTHTTQSRIFVDSSTAISMEDDANSATLQWTVPTMSVGKLYHLVMVFNDNDGYTLYLNGAFISTIDNDAFSGIDVNSVGGVSGGGSYNFNGIVDEISFWAEELTLAKVQEIFNDGVALDLSNSSLYSNLTYSNLTYYWRNNGRSVWTELKAGASNTDITPTTTADATMLLPQGTTAGKDILGFPLTHPNNGWLNLDREGYVDAGDNDLFTFINGGFSLECWFKMDGTPANNTYLIAKQAVDAAGNSDNAEYSVFIGTDNKIIFRLQDDSASAYIGQKTDAAISLNQWYHLVCTHTAGGTTSATCKIYLGETTTPTSTTTVADTANETGTYVAMENTNISLYIGTRSGYGTNDGLNGSIDEVRIYDRELSATEITKNYNHGKSKHS